MEFGLHMSSQKMISKLHKVTLMLICKYGGNVEVGKIITLQLS